MDYRYLGKQIRHYRRASGMSQTVLAKAIGLSAAHVGHIERGSRRASLDTVVAISRQLHVSLDELIFPKSLTADTAKQRQQWQKLETLIGDARELIGELSRTLHADG